MGEELFKIEANEKGVWISALTDDVRPFAVTEFLRSKGVRKYDEKAVEEFVRQKNRAPRKIAARDEKNEKAASVSVQLSKDNLSAAVTVEAPFFTKPWPDKAEIQNALQSKSVVFGVDEKAISELVTLRMSDESVVVAQGVSPQNGDDARIELYLDPDNAPEIDQDAQRVDYRMRSVFVNVRQGQEIAVKHPATAGKNGKTVVGTEIKAVPGKDVPFPIENGFAISEDTLLLTAAIDGRLARYNGKLSVLPELNVSGDVDFGVGNIDFTGSVKISGAVREGFYVVAKGDIDILEMVEGAHVESGGNIVISGGVRGMGKARIIAGGNIVLGFADQASIRGDRDIRIKNSVFHSDVVAQNTVTVMGGQKSQIAGGKIQAGVEVVCQILGSEMGTKTEVVVGTPPQQLERRRELMAQITQHRENIEKLELNTAFLKKQELAGQLNEEKRAVMVAATKAKFQLQSALKSMEDELKDLEGRLELGKSKGVVRVKEICYPGVNIMIRGSAYAVREAVKYAAFVLTDGEIRLRSFDA